MLPDDNLLDVFRWLDRRFLERFVRLVSRKADAIVGRLGKRGPMLVYRRLSITVMNGGYICFSKNELFNVGQFCANFVEPTPRKPFDVYESALMPSYLFVESVHISSDDREPPRSVGESDVVTRTLRPLGDTTLGDTTLVLTTEFTVRGGDPAERDLVAMLYDYAWGSLEMYSFVDRTDLFDSTLIRTTSHLAFTTLSSAIIPHLVGWLTTPPAACHWNPTPTPREKYLGIYGDATSEIDDETLNELSDALIQEFRQATTPSEYVIVTVSSQDVNAVSDWSKTWDWCNSRTKERLTGEHKHQYLSAHRRPNVKPAVTSSAN